MEAPHELTPGSGDHPSRRTVLRSGLQAGAAVATAGTGMTALLALVGSNASASNVSTDVPFARAVTSTAGDSAHRLPAAHATSTRSHPQPLWMSTWADPIDRLDTYTGHRVGVRFAKRAIMLTVDDGPSPLWTPRYLRLFAKHHIRATFCVIGEQVRGNEHLIKAMVTEGHHVGNHTFHHPLNLPSLSAHAIRREIEDTTDAVVRASGFRPRQFRAPGGVWGRDVFVEVAKQKMMPLGWDIDPRDWSLPGVTEIRHAMLASRPHDIILCHDGGGDRSQTYSALKTVIPALLARGWTFVTLPAPQ